MSIALAADIVGYIGSAMIIWAYFLLQSGKVTSDDITYPLINLIGAILLMISLMVHTNMPSIIIEIFWIGISVYGVWKILKKKNKSSS